MLLVRSVFILFLFTASLSSAYASSKSYLVVTGFLQSSIDKGFYKAEVVGVWEFNNIAECMAINFSFSEDKVRDLERAKLEEESSIPYVQKALLQGIPEEILKENVYKAKKKLSQLHKWSYVGNCHKSPTNLKSIM